MLLAATALAAAAPALAQDGGGDGASPWTVDAAWTVDVIGPVAGGANRRAEALDNIDLVADLDLGKAIGWDGASLHGYLLSNNGGLPNDHAGTLQGVDNIEVDRQGARLYELWLEAPLGETTTIRAGLYDLNSEFYANDSAGLLINPSFGIGSELAATGPNGPSIFPSTALAVRLDHGWDGGYVRGAVLNAHAGVPGDPDGVDLEFDHGALLIGEVGLTGNQRLSIGAWRYSDDQDDIRDLTPGGRPVRRPAQGLYVSGERVLAGQADGDGRVVTGFFRAGVSDGDTSPFKGGWQAGLLVERVFAGRPDSAFSVGVQQGYLSPKMRANMSGGGLDAASAETGLELTFSDRLSDRVTLQPDLQLILDPGGVSGADPVVVLGLRLTVDLL
ncbi:MAG TPA: carbohydrate porin [Caulobacter sp.]|nr:carbohydrate porin [Caulobacter sp.]